MKKINKKFAILGTSILVVVVVISVAIFLNSRDIKVNGSTVIIPEGKNKISVQICNNNILKVDNLINGKEGKHTAVIGDNKWSAVNVTVDKTTNPITMKTDKMTVKIDKNTHRIAVYNAKGDQSYVYKLHHTHLIHLLNILGNNENDFFYKFHYVAFLFYILLIFHGNLP